MKERKIEKKMVPDRDLNKCEACEALGDYMCAGTPEGYPTPPGEKDNK